MAKVQPLNSCSLTTPEVRHGFRTHISIKVGLAAAAAPTVDMKLSNRSELAAPPQIEQFNEKTRYVYRVCIKSDQYLDKGKPIKSNCKDYVITLKKLR